MTDYRMVLLEADCDLRCAELMVIALEVPTDTWDLEHVAAFVRAAYAQGFSDAMREPEPEQFFRRHGYRAPERRAA